MFSQNPAYFPIAGFGVSWLRSPSSSPMRVSVLRVATHLKQTLAVVCFYNASGYKQPPTVYDFWNEDSSNLTKWTAFPFPRLPVNETDTQSLFVGWDPAVGWLVARWWWYDTDSVYLHTFSTNSPPTASITTVSFKIPTPIEYLVVWYSSGYWAIAGRNETTAKPLLAISNRVLVPAVPETSAWTIYGLPLPAFNGTFFSSGSLDVYVDPIGNVFALGNMWMVPAHCRPYTDFTTVVLWTVSLEHRALKNATLQFSLSSIESNCDAVTEYQWISFLRDPWAINKTAFAISEDNGSNSSAKVFLWDGSNFTLPSTNRVFSSYNGTAGSVGLSERRLSFASYGLSNASLGNFSFPCESVTLRRMIFVEPNLWLDFFTNDDGLFAFGTHLHPPCPCSICLILPSVHFEQPATACLARQPCTGNMLDFIRPADYPGRLASSVCRRTASIGSDLHNGWLGLSRPSSLGFVSPLLSRLIRRTDKSSIAAIPHTLRRKDNRNHFLRR